MNDESVTQLEYLGAIAAALGVPPPTRRVPYRLSLTLGKCAEGAAKLARWDRPPPLMRYGVQVLGGENRFSIDRARNELGFVPDHRPHRRVCGAASSGSVNRLTA